MFVKLNFLTFRRHMECTDRDLKEEMDRHFVQLEHTLDDLEETGEKFIKLIEYMKHHKAEQLKSRRMKRRFGISHPLEELDENEEIGVIDDSFGESD